jgi:hypothetical protein
MRVLSVWGETKSWPAIWRFVRATATGTDGLDSGVELVLGLFVQFDVLGRDVLQETWP